MKENELIVTRVGHLGSIRLNRPEALNSLTLSMVRGFAAALAEFAADASTCAVLVTGAGERGLCAGGDIRRLYEMRAAGRDYYVAFWREEYQLNARIASYPKPYIVIMDGVVMGGGVGISAHGNCRIVTERTRVAMPETGIGFIPDVGGSWLLTRNGGAGVYLALSGMPVRAADAIYVGLADITIASVEIIELERELAAVCDATEVDEILSRFAKPADEAVLARQAPLLNRVMSCECMEGILSALSADNSSFARQVTEEIKARSPTSLKVTLELLKRATSAPRLEECLLNEFRAACRLFDSHDFYEGVRAAIIEKDRRPQWSPATLEGIDDATVRAILEGAGDAEPVFEPWPETARRARVST